MHPTDRPAPLVALRWHGGAAVPWPPGKIVCAGRNYVEHARELGNPVPAQPLLFIKPRTALVDLAAPIAIPRGRTDCHHEVELALLIGATLVDASREDAAAGIAGIALALDLTLRDLQDELKRQGHPWERAKAFDGSCPISHVMPLSPDVDLGRLEVVLAVNGVERQRGPTSLMIVPPVELVQAASRAFRLEPGDLVLTGTPAGVKALAPGDRLELSVVGLIDVTTRVAGP